jgi:ribosome modulation factor
MKGPGMSDGTSCNPHKEEDEGYLAAESGLNLAKNPYPKGTIRHEEWRRGWQIKTDETRREKGEGYMAAEAGRSLAQNPYPRGTIRFAEWRSGWQLRNEEAQRAIRLGRET